MMIQLTVVHDKKITKEQRKKLDRACAKGLSFSGDNLKDYVERCRELSAMPGVDRVVVTGVRETHYATWRDGKVS